MQEFITQTGIENYIPKKYRYRNNPYLQLEILQKFLLNTLNEVNLNKIFEALLEQLNLVLSSSYARISLYKKNDRFIYDNEIRQISTEIKIKHDVQDKLIKIINACDNRNHICLEFKTSHVINENNTVSDLLLSIMYFPLINKHEVFGFVYFFVDPNIQHFECYKLDIVRNFLNYVTPFLYELIKKTDLNLSDESNLREIFKFDEIIGHHPKLLEILEIVSHVSNSEATILIQGECGTGKELIARAIHQNSRRSAKPFLPINCGAIPENLLESELFGHVRGAFTGAVKNKEGWFEKADGGTLFLDEVSKMSPALQIKLLRILQTGEYS